MSAPSTILDDINSFEEIPSQFLLPSQPTDELEDMVCLAQALQSLQILATYAPTKHEVENEDPNVVKWLRQFVKSVEIVEDVWNHVDGGRYTRALARLQCFQVLRLGHAIGQWVALDSTFSPRWHRLWHSRRTLQRALVFQGLLRHPATRIAEAKNAECIAPLSHDEREELSCDQTTKPPRFTVNKYEKVSRVKGDGQLEADQIRIGERSTDKKKSTAAIEADDTITVTDAKVCEIWYKSCDSCTDDKTLCYSAHSEKSRASSCRHCSHRKRTCSGGVRSMQDIGVSHEEETLLHRIGAAVKCTDAIEPQFISEWKSQASYYHNKWLSSASKIQVAAAKNLDMAQAWELLRSELDQRLAA